MPEILRPTDKFFNTGFRPTTAEMLTLGASALTAPTASVAELPEGAVIVKGRRSAEFIFASDDDSPTEGTDNLRGELWAYWKLVEWTGKWWGTEQKQPAIASQGQQEKSIPRTAVYHAERIGTFTAILGGFDGLADKFDEGWDYCSTVAWTTDTTFGANYFTNMFGDFAGHTHSAAATTDSEVGRLGIPEFGSIHALYPFLYQGAANSLTRAITLAQLGD